MANIIGKAIGAGLYKAEIRTADGNVYGIKAIQSIATTPDSQITEVEGADKKLGSFTFTNAEEAQLQINGIEMDCLQAILGEALSHSSNSRYNLRLGTVNGSNPPYFELKGYSVARDMNGVKAEVQRTLFKCQIQGGIEFGQSFQEALSIQTTVKAFPTDKDIMGVSLGAEAISDIDLRSA